MFADSAYNYILTNCDIIIIYSIFWIEIKDVHVLLYCLILILSVTVPMQITNKLNLSVLSNIHFQTWSIAIHAPHYSSSSAILWESRV